MSGHETPDELRARLDALAEAATERPWELAWQYRDCGRCRTEGVVREEDDGTWVDLTGDDIRLVVALVNAWPAIDALLARLTAAEADADLWQDIAHKVADDSFTDGKGALRHYYDEALALRERPPAS